MTTAVATHKTAAIVSIGHGGHTLHLFPQRDDSGKVTSTSRLTGYCTSLESFMRDCGKLGAYLIPANTAIVDLTTGDMSALIEFAVKGPMIEASLAPGTMSTFMGGVEEWTRDTTVGALDMVAPDVYLQLVTRAVPGVNVFYPADDILY